METTIVFLLIAGPLVNGLIGFFAGQTEHKLAGFMFGLFLGPFGWLGVWMVNQLQHLLENNITTSKRVENDLMVKGADSLPIFKKSSCVKTNFVDEEISAPLSRYEQHKGTKEEEEIIKRYEEIYS
jgi:hypothetical protein